MSTSPPEAPWAAKWLEILERSYQRYARREKLPEDDFQELFLEYARCVARGEAPKKLWGWADVVLRRLAARRRTLASAGERLPENLVASEGEFREGPEFLVPMHRRETWEEIRDRVMESFPAAYRKAIGIMPECSSMHEWARETGFERVDLRRIIERVAQVARGFLPPPLAPISSRRNPTAHENLSRGRKVPRSNSEYTMRTRRSTFVAICASSLALLTVIGSADTWNGTNGGNGGTGAQGTPWSTGNPPGPGGQGGDGGNGQSFTDLDWTDSGSFSYHAGDGGEGGPGGQGGNGNLQPNYSPSGGTGGPGGTGGTGGSISIHINCDDCAFVAHGGDGGPGGKGGRGGTYNGTGGPGGSGGPKGTATVTKADGLSNSSGVGYPGEPGGPGPGGDAGISPPE